MGRPLPLRLESAPVAPDEAPVSFRSVVEAGVICVEGQLSTGSRGWTLHAAAAIRRSVIVMQVTAVELPPGNGPDLEYHTYRATIRVHRRGKFRLQVRHAYRSVGVMGVCLPDPVYECTLAVP